MSLRTRIAMFSALAAVAVAPHAASAAEGAEPAGSWLGLTFFAINFALFVIIVVKFAGPMASKYFRDRANEIGSSLDRLTSALKAAEDYANRAAAKMAELDNESARLKSEIESESAFQVNRIREGARATAQSIRRDTELSGVAIADAAQHRVRERLAANAAFIARELIARSFEASDQARLIDSFMEKIRHEAAQ